MVCTGSLGLATPSSTEVHKDSKWNEALFLLCHTETNGTKPKSFECPSPKRDWECVQSCSAVCFSPLTIQKALGDLLNDLSSQIRSLQWHFTGHSMSLRDHVQKYCLKISQISQRPKKANKIWCMHSLSGGWGVGVCFLFDWVFVWLFFNSYHLLFPKANRKPGNNFKCTCINSKLASVGNQRSSSSFRQFHALHLAQVNLKKQKKMLISELSSSNQWLSQRSLVKTHPSHWVPHSLGM